MMDKYCLCQLFLYKFKLEDAIMEKEKSHVFDIDIYLLGSFNNGERFWLEAAKWSCDWYWGFGYIETYTNNKNPAKARNITSHQHYNDLCSCRIEREDYSGEYLDFLSENKNISKCVLTKSEQWQLSDLMKSFYTLRDTAEIMHSGYSGLISNTDINLKDMELYTHINKVLMPKIFQAVYALLDPDLTID